MSTLVGGAGWGGGTASREVIVRAAHGAPALATTVWRGQSRRMHTEVYVEA